MSLLKLHNIGKIYNSNDVLTIGIRNINLEFDLNEFVVIEGESGSGKSTLLNVIGANDTYEEGEMYFNGEETSHYGISEWEKYREENIATIFQDFNIIENLTVLENVELALLRFDDSKKRKKIAKDLIDKVGLTKQINQKGSKLSGGEKQRCVIARALAKDSPIILADEPTGNLDVKSSKDISKLLKDVSKDKLVIVVTHNPEYFKDYATRRVRVFDGGIQENEIITKIDEKKYKKKERNITKFHNLKNTLILGIMNYKSRPKFSLLMTFSLCIMAITLFVTLEIFGNNLIKPITDSIDGTPINGKIILLSDDNKFEDDEIDNLIDKLKPSYVMKNKNNSSYMITIPSGAKGFDKEYQIKIIYNPYKYNLESNEGLLSIPYSYNHISNNIINIFTKANIGINSISVKNKIDNNDIVLYLSNYTLDNYSKLIRSIYSEIRINSTRTNVYTFKINDELEDGYVNLLNSNFWDIIGKKIILEIKSSNSYTVNNSIQGFNGEELIVEINSNDYNKLFNEKEEIDQTCFYYENNEIAKKNLNNLPNGYVAYLSNSKTYVKNADNIYVYNIIYFTLLICFSICFALLVNLIFSRSVKVYQSDFAIYKTLGISYKVSSKSLYVQFALIFIPTLFILPLVSLITTLIKNSGMVFISLSNYLIIEFVLLLIIIIVTLGFNRSIKNESIRKSLKRGSK